MKRPRGVRVAFIRELEAAIDDRDRAHQLREVVRSTSWQKRIDKRAAAVRVHLDGLVAQAVVLDP